MNGYFGKLGRRIQNRNTAVSEWFYPGNYQIGRHSHDSAYLSVVLSGQYRETVDRKENEIDVTTVVVHRPGESHHDIFGTKGAIILSVDMPAEWFAPLLDSCSQSLYTGSDVSAAIVKLDNEMRSQSEESEWFVESAVLHLIGVLIRRRKNRYAEPLWLREVTTFLHDNYSRNTPLEELAALAHVHPVSLSRHFRRVHRCSIGEYVRAIRVDSALQDLEQGKKSIAEIAAEHGFSDQSHLTRLLRINTGTTPAKWRTQRNRGGY